ncbi:hypothetical protein EDB81DRAFT_636731 [Dactylonectria macrodidyma]|uniref:2EXR domain-containing protein n=1 Tax=Dactylonectria macrodidyma TaxID=307937 RepID=A0A9P9FPN8_9HYPO|nr:hypothetical protein EDB81DRAFT_636731 [Dactylonectria macrodidyma]
MASNFPSFCKLPPELRSMVWVYALPEPRVFEILDTPQSNLRTPAQDGLTFANSCHEPPPPLAAVCRESRAFVLRSYTPLTLSHTTKYMDPSRDIILLEPYLLIRRLLRALHFLAQISQMRDHISQVALGTSYGFSTGIFHPITSGKVSRNNTRMLLAKLSRFPRLKKVLFIIHEEFQFVSPKVAFPGRSLQLFHHSYTRKLDGEAEASRHYQWRFHQNDMRFYPLKVEDTRDDEPDVDEFEFEDEDEERDRRPTNEDWRRFKRRFLKAIYMSTERRPHTDRRPKPPQLKVEGANLLWKYRSY